MEIAHLHRIGAFCRASGDAFADGNMVNLIQQEIGHTLLGEQAQALRSRVQRVQRAGLAVEFSQDICEGLGVIHESSSSTAWASRSARSMNSMAEL